MFSLLFRVPPDHEDYVIAELTDHGTTGITEEPGGVRAFFDETSDCKQLIERFAVFAPEFRQEKTTDWEQMSRDAFPPLSVGKRFYLVPPWNNEPTPAGRLRLEVNPGMACGTGRHPATQLCLRAIEMYVNPGSQVLDVGTGSGILARAAALMGARSVVACDVDQEAVQVARECADSPPLFVGSADAARSGWADVIIANIDSATLDALAPELGRVRKSASVLILSGFPADDPPERFQAIEALKDADWLCWIA